MWIIWPIGSWNGKSVWLVSAALGSLFKDVRMAAYLAATIVVAFAMAPARGISQTLADRSATFGFAYTVDANGAIVQTDMTDPRGIVERLMFNADHYVVSDTDAVGTADDLDVAEEADAGAPGSERGHRPAVRGRPERVIPRPGEQGVPLLGRAQTPPDQGFEE